MSTLKKSRLNPRSLRVILAIFLLLIIGLGAAGFVYAQKELLSYAKEISRKKVDANASNSSISTLQNVQKELQGYDDVKQKIGALRAGDEFPIFRIVDEVNKIASRNNVPISSFSFGNSAAAPAAGASPAPTTPAPAIPAVPSASSSKIISLTVNFGQISNYQDYLQFLYDIEQNVPKMRVTSVSVNSGAATPDANATQNTTGQSGSSASSGEFSIQPLTVELYIQ